MSITSGKKTLYIILAIAGCGFVFAIAACAGLIYWGSGLFAELPNVQAGASKFLDDIDAGRIDTAYDSAAPAFQAKLTREEFASFVKHYPVLQKQTRRTMTGMRIYQRPTGEQATINYQLSNDKNSLALMLSLVKVNGQWRVESMNVP
jgi:hypothetical protein